MYNKVNPNYNKRRMYDYEPPPKKLVSDGDLFIKQLAEKQRNTKTSLTELISSKKEFYKATELVSPTNNTSGARDFQEFQSVIRHSDEVEKLKSAGLETVEVELVLDVQKGKSYLEAKHKNVDFSTLDAHLQEILEKINNSPDCSKKRMQDKHKNVTFSTLDARLQEILEKINDTSKFSKRSSVSSGRLTTELVLSTKPASMETKLLKFALESGPKCTKEVPHPMDDLKDIHIQIMQDLAPINVKKIRKKARRLANEITSLTPITLKEMPKLKTTSFSSNSKWDQKHISTVGMVCKAKDVGCKPQNFYTIKQGQIVKVDSISEVEQVCHTRLSTEEIRKLPKFNNYEVGAPSKVLYLQHVANGVVADDIINLGNHFSNQIVSVKIMNGRMRGKAFIEMDSEESAKQFINNYNGVFLKGKPLVIQFGKRAITSYL